MRFLKYLVFLIITICSSSVFAVTYKAVDGSKNSATGSTPDAACRAFYSKYISYSGAPAYSRAESGACYYTSGVYAYYSLIPDPPLECPDVGYPLYVYFDAGGQIPQQRCQPLQDKFCVFKAKPDSIILNHQNDRQSTVLYNVSKTPVSSCTPLDQGQCDKKDPYGGCYQPPNDGCTRLADGSISCPDDTPPPDIKNTCSGASYCNRPPDGCGSGYVSGSFNGQAVCVKSSPSSGGQGSGTATGTGEGSGTGTGTGTGTGSGTGTGVNTGTGSTNINNTSNSSSTSNTTINNSDGSSAGSSSTKTDIKIDFSPVVQAISALSDKLTWVKSELVNAVSRVEDKLTQTNTKLDSVKSSVDQTTQAVNANGDKVKSAVDANTAATNGVKSAVDANTNSTASKLNDVVNAINNKPVGGGGGSTDMKPTNDILTSIKEFLTGKADTSSLKADLPSQEVSSQSLDAGFFQSSPQCPPDVALALPGLGSYTFSYSRFCDALQIAGYFIMIAAYFFAALIVSKA